jgi:hypothetical protein
MPARFVTITLLLIASVQVLGAPGVAYRGTINRSEEAARTEEFSVIGSGNRLRASHTNAPEGAGVLYDSLIRPETSAVIALNSRNHTWYPAPDVSPFALDSRYLTPSPTGKVKNVSVTLKPDDGNAPEHRYSGEIRYDVFVSYRTTTVKVSCVATFTLITTPAVARQHWVGRILPETGYTDVDAKLRAAEATIHGFPVHLTLEARRTYTGGMPMVQSMTVEVSDIRDASPDQSVFTRPADYHLQEPVRGYPGATRQ